MAKEAPKRYRFSVPIEDTSVIKWLEVQQNIGYSLRSLIREDIQRNGYTDATCHEVEQGPKRGRPTGTGTEKKGESEEKEEMKTVPQTSVQQETQKKPPKEMDDALMAMLG